MVSNRGNNNLMIEKVVLATGKWVNGKWVKGATEAISEMASRGRWVNGKWVKETTQVVGESTTKSKALVNFTTKPATTSIESGKVYTKMKLDHSPAADCFASRFTIPTTKVEPANLEEFLAGLKTSKYSKPPVIPTDIPAFVDFSAAIKGITGRVIPVRDKSGNLIREYVSAPNGKDLSVVKVYNVATGKPKIIINYKTQYGKTLPSYFKELDPNTGTEVKRAMYWDNTLKLKGVRSIDEMGQEVTVKYKENGVDIDYVTHGGKSVYNS